MKLVVLTVGRGGCDWADTAVADYTRRLRRHGGITEEHVKAEKFRGDVDAVREAESARILDAIGSRDQLIALDERGKGLSSEAFAKLLHRARISSVNKLVFAIGGAYGHDAALRRRADKVLRLSPMVLNHEVARVVLYEQIYRGMAILSGSPYHH